MWVAQKLCIPRVPHRVPVSPDCVASVRARYQYASRVTRLALSFDMTRHRPRGPARTRVRQPRFLHPNTTDAHRICARTRVRTCLCAACDALRVRTRWRTHLRDGEHSGTYLTLYPVSLRVLIASALSESVSHVRVHGTVIRAHRRRHHIEPLTCSRRRPGQREVGGGQERTGERQAEKEKEDEGMGSSKRCAPGLYTAPASLIWTPTGPISHAQTPLRWLRLPSPSAPSPAPLPSRRLRRRRGREPRPSPIAWVLQSATRASASPRRRARPS